MLLQYACLGYIYDIYFVQYLFSFLVIILLSFSTCRKKKESLKLAQSEEMCIVKVVHDYILIRQ